MRVEWRCLAFGTTQVPVARQTICDSSRTSAARVADIFARHDDFAGFKAHFARRIAVMGDFADCFDVIASVNGRQEFDFIVAGKQTFITVTANQQFGRDIAEQLQHAGAVDKFAAVMGVGKTHSQSDHSFSHINAPLQLFRGAAP